MDIQILSTVILYASQCHFVSTIIVNSHFTLLGKLSFVIISTIEKSSKLKNTKIDAYVQKI